MGQELQNTTILIIDDNVLNIKTIVECLNDSNFETIIARDGEMGLQRARYSQPDLILLDVVMPGINGFETCRRLKADEQTRDIPILFMTVLTSIEDKVKGLDLGAADYITKPFQEKELLSRMTTHLRLRELSRRLEEKVQERTVELTAVNEQLQKKSAEVEEVNIALRVLVKQQGQAIEEEQHRILHHLEKSVYPYITLLGKTLTSTEEKRFLDIIDKQLHSIGSSFIKKISNPDLNLTKKEILVSDLVRQGKKTLEIADLFNLHPRTVEVYRTKIRKKLHINNKNISLQQYLETTFSH